MSYSLKKRYSLKINDPESCMEKLKRAYDEMGELIVSKELFKDDQEFLKRDEELGKWTIEPSLSRVPNPVAAAEGSPGVLRPPSQQPLLSPAGLIPNLGKTFPSSSSGYPAAIVLSVTLISLTYLTYAKLFSPQLSFVFGALALSLFFGFVFGPAIIDKLAQYLKSALSSEDEETESVAGLFEDAHKEYYLVYFFTRHEGSGKIVEDRQSEARSKLQNIYRKIYSISEVEWYTRKLINDSNTIKMSIGAASASQVSDFTG